LTFTPILTIHLIKKIKVIKKSNIYLKDDKYLRMDGVITNKNSRISVATQQALREMQGEETLCMNMSMPVKYEKHDFFSQ
jgi:hypothetical protein